jgi:outer membrane biosynthesis protein TonB
VNNTPTAAQAPLAPDSTYHLITALDRPPAPLTRPDACYPYGATGEVAYELLIDEAGTVNQVTVLAVKPVGLFTAAAAELCSALKFSPAIKDGRAVRSRVRFVVSSGPG